MRPALADTRLKYAKAAGDAYQNRAIELIAICRRLSRLSRRRDQEIELRM